MTGSNYQYLRHTNNMAFKWFVDMSGNEAALGVDNEPDLLIVLGWGNEGSLLGVGAFPDYVAERLTIGGDNFYIVHIHHNFPKRSARRRCTTEPTHFTLGASIAGNPCPFSISCFSEAEPWKGIRKP
jgi:hypothetical protein